MKLNNKGFAISTIMYMILVMAIILLTLTLTLLSSRKLILDKQKKEIIDYIYGDDYICIPVTESTKTTGNIPKGNYEIGDEYICKVKPGLEYHFFILSTEANMINLIMDSNISRDGEAVKSNEMITKLTDSNFHTAWISDDDYVKAGGTQQHELWNNNRTIGIDKGPVTALKFLKEATSTFENISSYTKRLPEKEEIDALFKNSNYSMDKGKFALNQLPVWVTNYMWNTNSVEGVYYQDSSYHEDRTNITYMRSYWLKEGFIYNPDVAEKFQEPVAYEVGFDMAYYGSSFVAAEASTGVRFVVSLPKQKIKNQDYICIPVTESTKTTGNIPKGNYEIGDEYICEVKPGLKYHFFILSKKNNTVSLIMDSNISRDGEAIKSNKMITKFTEDKFHTAWINETDYINVGGKEQHNVNDTILNLGIDKGPVTALKFLKEATSTFENISSYIKRLPEKEEIDALFKNSNYSMDKGKFALNQLPVWVTNYMLNLGPGEKIDENNDSGKVGYQETSYSPKRTNVTYMRNYWVYDSFISDPGNTAVAYAVGFDFGFYGYSYVHEASSSGVRFVVDLPKNKIKIY